jgi:hypothetical protein
MPVVGFLGPARFVGSLPLRLLDLSTYLSDLSCRWHHDSRPLRAVDHNVPAALLPRSASRASIVGIVRGDDKSARGVDFAPILEAFPGTVHLVILFGTETLRMRGLQAAVCHESRIHRSLNKDAHSISRLRASASSPHYYRI